MRHVHKRCSKCGKKKPATNEHFIPSRDCQGGLASTCRKCRRKWLAGYRDRNREKLRRRSRDDYKRIHGPAVAEKRRVAAERRPLVITACSLRTGMFQRSRECGIPFDEASLTSQVLQKMLTDQPNCECCGATFAIGRKGDGVKRNNSASMDRIVPSEGYVIGNVALICWRCNNLKRDATPEELETVAVWLLRKLEIRRDRTPEPAAAECK